MAVRERLDRRTALGRKYRTMRGFTYEGKDFAAGDDFPIDGMSVHHVSTLHGSRYIDLVPAETPAADSSEDRGVTFTDKGGGNYEITAPWLDAPVKIRGKAAATDEVERIRNEGPPLGFIEGGSEVTVEDVGSGGWFTVNAPWLEEPEKVQGRAAAETRQRELHDAGEPALHHGVSLTAVGNGWFDVKADWEPETEKVQGQEAATARAAELREQGAPPPPPPGNGANETNHDGETEGGAGAATQGESTTAPPSSATPASPPPATE